MDCSQCGRAMLPTSNERLRLMKLKKYVCLNCGRMVYNEVRHGKERCYMVVVGRLPEVIDVS